MVVAISKPYCEAVSATAEAESNADSWSAQIIREASRLLSGKLRL
jgi:hypothetical protein